jgi:uncharacterized protein (DUF302 family)
MNSIILAVVWVLAGMAIMGLIVWFVMPFLMLIRYKSKLSFDETVTVLSETLNKKQDWRVVTVNDYQKCTEAFAALEKVSSVSICNPRYVAKILTNDKDRGVTAFMPLGLGVYEDKKGNVFVSQLNVGLLGIMFGGTIAEVMGMAGKDIKAVVKSVAAE